MVLLPSKRTRLSPRSERTQPLRAGGSVCWTSKSVNTSPLSLRSFRLAFVVAGSVTSTVPLSDENAIALASVTRVKRTVTLALTEDATTDPDTPVRRTGPLTLFTSRLPSTPSTEISPPLTTRSSRLVRTGTSISRSISLFTDRDRTSIRLLSSSTERLPRRPAVRRRMPAGGGGASRSNAVSPPRCVTRIDTSLRLVPFTSTLPLKRCSSTVPSAPGFENAISIDSVWVAPRLLVCLGLWNGQPHTPGSFHFHESVHIVAMPLLKPRSNGISVLKPAGG